MTLHANNYNDFTCYKTHFLFFACHLHILYVLGFSHEILGVNVTEETIGAGWGGGRIKHETKI